MARFLEIHFLGGVGGGGGGGGGDDDNDPNDYAYDDVTVVHDGGGDRYRRGPTTIRRRADLGIWAEESERWEEDEDEDEDEDEEGGIEPSSLYSSSSSPSMIQSSIYDSQRRSSSSSSRRRIDPSHVALGSGASSLLSNALFVLAEEGDGVLIPAPYR